MLRRARAGFILPRLQTLLRSASPCAPVVVSLSARVRAGEGLLRFSMLRDRRLRKALLPSLPWRRLGAGPVACAGSRWRREGFRSAKGCSVQPPAELACFVDGPRLVGGAGGLGLHVRRPEDVIFPSEGHSLSALLQVTAAALCALRCVA